MAEELEKVNVMMRYNSKKIFSIFYVFSLILAFTCSPVIAAEGDCGYEGGISSGTAVNKLYDYKEVIFVTGKPIVVEGTLTVKKSMKSDTETWTYIYSNLKNDTEKVTMNRTISFNAAVNSKEQNQIQKQVSIKGTPTEVIKVDKKTYTLKKYSFSKSTIIDVKPMAQYFAGEFMGEKTYSISGGTGTSTGTAKVTSKGEVFGYNQHWSNTESQNIEYTVQSSEGSLNWTGTAKVGISMTTSKKMNYQENKPDAISFEGGFIQTENNVCVLQYESEFPEFDKNSKPTDYLIKSRDTLNFDTFPYVTRLVTPSLNQIKGHWAGNDIKSMYALEIFKEKSQDFRPQDYMTRGEFARAMVMAGRLMTDDEIEQAQAKFDTGSTASAKKKTARTGGKNQEIQVFEDVPTDFPYYSYIMKAYDEKIMEGLSNTVFGPQAAITRAQAVKLIIRALGLENRAPSPVAVTSFRDNDSIPSWARNSAYVAEKLGLVKGDSYGNFNPDKNLTKAEIASLLNRFIGYMRSGIIKDYRENAILY